MMGPTERMILVQLEMVAESTTLNYLTAYEISQRIWKDGVDPRALKKNGVRSCLNRMLRKGMVQIVDVIGMGTSPNKWAITIDGREALDAHRRIKA